MALSTLVSMPRHVSFRQPPALQLLGALCQPDTNSASAVAAGALSTQVTDWAYFLELAAHHRLRPLAWKGAMRLGVSMPEEVQRTLREQSIGNAREAFRYLTELQRLLELLTSAGIGVTVLKGVPLSNAAYGDVGLREVGDIDLLIEPLHVATADALLRQSGLKRQEPSARLTPRRSAFYAKYFKDYTYDPRGGAASGFEVDLHWRLVRDATMAQVLLPRNGAGERSELLRIGTLEIEVLTRERCLFYLAVHGATEGWARWKSLADIAALWSTFSEQERPAVWSAAETSGSADFVRAALELVERWMGPLPGFVSTDKGSHGQLPLADYIVDYAEKRMVEGRGMPSPASQTTFAMKRHEARLYPSFSSRRAIAMRVLFRPRVWGVVNLPDTFFFLYPVLSPIEWFYFRAKRWLASKRAKGSDQ